MKPADSRKQKKSRKYSSIQIGGLVVGGLLLFSTLGSVLQILRHPNLPYSVALVPLVPAVAIIIRSLRPPITSGRGLAVVFGGMFAGQIPLSLGGAAPEQLPINLFLGALGIFLLWVGFKKPKTKAATKQETPGENIQIGMSANDRNRQAALIDELIQQIRDAESMEPAAKQSSEKNLEKIKEEILEEEQPDSNRIAKWLGKVQSLLPNIDKAGKVHEKAKKVFRSFNLPFNETGPYGPDEMTQKSEVLNWTTEILEEKTRPL